MPQTVISPWASGPAEILRHGLSLLKTDSDTNRRLAMISIDNAVELMVKTYLGLPKRVTQLTISRKEYAEFSESFPGLLDALEKHAATKLDGINLGEIEWYHRLRNQLYHQGNGLTVERDKVEIYAELANVLFKNLFGERLVAHVSAEPNLLGQFIELWVELEQTALVQAAEKLKISDHLPPRSVSAAIRAMRAVGMITDAELKQLEHIRNIRNKAVHGEEGSRDLITPEIIDQLKGFIAKIPNPKGKSGTSAKLGSGS